MSTSSLPKMYYSSPQAVPFDFGNTFQANYMLQLLCNTSKADGLDVNTSVVTASFAYACLENSIMVRQQ